MDIANATSLGRHTIAVTFVIGLHVILALALIAGTVVTRVPDTIDHFKARFIERELPLLPSAPPPPVADSPQQRLDIPAVVIPDVRGPTSERAIVIQPPYQPSAPIVTTPPVTAARVAKGLRLAELCQAYYPSASRRLGEQGSVVVLIYVATSGVVTESRIETSSGVQRLDEAAQKCVTREGRFEPQRVGSDPVGSWQRMKYTWRLSS